MFDSIKKIQESLPVIGKDKKGYNYTYASLEKVWEEIGKIIQENGFILTNQIEKDGVRTIATHQSGEKLESFIPFSKEELKPQDKGSEISYYRRYNLTSIFNIIISDEDDDAQATRKEKFKKPEVDFVGAMKKLRTATDLEELQTIWNKLSKDERGDSEVIGVKDEMKNNLQ